MTTVFPDGFHELEPFADWAIQGERARYAKRVASTMAELQAFYDVAFPLLRKGTVYLEQVAMEGIGEQDKRLLWAFCSLVTVAFPVEAWGQPRVPDSGPASINAVVEPAV
ncbi:hypothetical protein [Streptomyces sp. NPDC091215]|uniref:hypothetical protein n=1 Tax=Streptomyces sp. NPDC091215 TaxID=3155192 RepID=UPI003422DDEA